MTTNLLVAVVVLHAVLGCCMHHSHAAEPFGAAPAGSMHGASGCHRHHGKECDSHGPDHGGQGSCHEERCVYIRPPRDDSKVAAPGILQSSAPYLLEAIPTSGLLPLLASAAGFPTCLSPVRSHLAKHVLLI